MAETRPQVQPQEFRLVQKDSTMPAPLLDSVSIQPRLDKSSGDYVILWDDILIAFKNATYIRNGRTLVPFLMDENFQRINPLRIQAFPDVVLDVVLDTTNNGIGPESIRVENPTALSPTSALIQDSSQYSAIMETRSSSISFSGRVEDSGYGRRTKAAPQYRGEVLENSMPVSPKSLVRAPQFIPDNFNGSDSFYHHKRISTIIRQSPESSLTEKLGIDHLKTPITGNIASNVICVPENVSPNAANQGLASAQLSQSALCDDGKGSPPEYSEIIERYQKAAYQGDTDAQYKLGAIYSNGKGVPQDYPKATEWYLKAADQGHTNARYKLAVMYENGKGVAQDYPKAITWYLKAANQGHVDACYKLAVMYENGKGVPHDYQKAAEWCLKAANQGHVYAQCNLGAMYSKGMGVPQDYPKAIEWYLKAANHGDLDAQRALSAMYSKGLGVPQNLYKAMYWNLKASNQGDADAESTLRIMYKSDKGDKGVLQGHTKHTKPKKWWMKAVEF